MRDHWGDSAESALDCVFATLRGWYGGGPKEMTADSREHAVRAVLFAQQRLVELRAERDEAREDAAHWRFHADGYVRLLAECEQALGRASDADVANFEQLTALADEARELGDQLAALQVAENAARLDGEQQP